MPHITIKNPKVKEEILKCKSDFAYFAGKYLKILDAENNRFIKFKPNLAQMRLLNAVQTNNWIYALKARQVGITTGIAAINFWKALFTPNYKVAVIAHTNKSAKNIFEIYASYYNNLPEFLKVQTKAANVNEIIFVTGSAIKVASATSESLRGSTYNSLHLSEFAFYDDIPRTMASILQTATKNALVILETTPNGQNEAKTLWDEDNGYEKVFISWMDNAKYVSDLPPRNKIDFIETFLNSLKLSDEQRNWVYEIYQTKTGGDWNLFKQEYASDPLTCFIASGENYFNCQFPVQSITTGYMEHASKEKYSSYIMGVDVAGGSKTGDYSAFVVLDVTNPSKSYVAASFYERLSPSMFADIVLETARRFNALVVVENNSYGLSVLENLQKAEYPFLYRKVQFDKMTDKFKETLGFHTTAQTRPFLLAKLQQYVNEKRMIVNDTRLQYEINTFVYTSSGRPEASGKKHDDIIFAAALALQGLDQVNDELADEIIAQKPANIREVLELESKLGTPWEQMKEHFPDEPITNWFEQKEVNYVDDVFYLDD